jgi:hypothetical protein
MFVPLGGSYRLGTVSDLRKFAPLAIRAGQ